MKQEGKSRRNGWLDEERKKLLKVLLIPLVVLILIVVIVIADRASKGKKSQEKESGSVVAETMESLETETAESTLEETDQEETETADEFAADNFLRDSDPEITKLLKSYFKARAGADPELMNQVYGVEGMAEWQLEEQKTKLWANSKYVTDFEKIATYVKDGPVADTWLVYAVADIRFRAVETTAPMVMWTFVTKNTEGIYRLKQNEELSSPESAFAEESNRSEEVRRLAASVNNRLKEALTADADLNSIYGILNSNSPVWASETQPEPEVEILEEAPTTQESQTEALQTEAPQTEESQAGQ